MMRPDTIWPPQTGTHSSFYAIPKVYKPHIPLQPIVSACDSSTDQPSNYISHFIQPIVETLHSYIHGSKNFIHLFDSLPPLPENSILITTDVTLLYIKIPSEEGIESAVN